jgi:hypothetical protein
MVTAFAFLIGSPILITIIVLILGHRASAKNPSDNQQVAAISGLFLIAIWVLSLCMILGYLACYVLGFLPAVIYG